MKAKQVRAEHEKLKTFWEQEGKRMRKTLGTPQLTRLHDSNAPGIDIRHLHNRFGWQAGGGVHCAGTLYRTENFIRIADEKRCGNKKGQTIHLEHTVPIATLALEIKNISKVTPYETLMWVLEHSVITAATHEERQTIVRSGQHRSSNVFTKDGDRGYPFRRYCSDRHLLIWDVVNCRLVDREAFTFDCHRQNIAAVLGWAGIKNWK
jgi:hypothetical protein